MNIDEFPIEIRHLMMYRQKEQHGIKDWDEFQKNGRVAGFTWSKTPEKQDFWFAVINREEFDVFYAKYPKVEYPKNMPEEIIMLALDRRVEQGWSHIYNGTLGFGWGKTPEGTSFWSHINRGNYHVYYKQYGFIPTTDAPLYKGEIAGFPPEVVKMMLQRQFEQTGKRDITVFEENREANSCTGKGFTWRKTTEGHDFWGDVIVHKRFEVFFDKYPKDSIINSPIKTKQNEKGNTTSKGIKVQRPVATISTGERRTTSGISGRRSSTAVASRHISYQTIIGL